MVGPEPEGEVVEYVKRDVANIVLGNKDNHGRNTAVQRHCDGTVRLAPVFDFAPMRFMAMAMHSWASSERAP